MIEVVAAIIELDKKLLAFQRGSSKHSYVSNKFEFPGGKVEPGETLEGAVVREVFEEVGVNVGTVKYMGSQPWPFPHSLMLGFRAEWVSGDIVCDPTEILDANWYRKDALPNIPPGISIARKLIDAWLNE